VFEMNELLRIIFLVYFITHIPITACLDLQVILGEYYPESLQQITAWYVQTYHDPLIGEQPIWFKSFIWAEFLFQMPFFFVAAYGLLFRKNWIRIPSIAYGMHVATTVWGILAEFIFSKSITDQEKLTLFAFYVPYLIIPLLLALYMCFTEVPFPGKKQKKV